MIDIKSEELILLRDLPKRLPRRNGKKINMSTVYRWRQVGCRGKRLETVKIGGDVYTSWDAVNRFSAEDHVDTKTSSTREHQKAVNELEMELS